MLIQPHHACSPIPISTPASNNDADDEDLDLDNSVVRRRWAYANDIPGSRSGPEDGPWPRPYELLSEEDIWHELRVLGRPQSRVIHNNEGCFKGCIWSRADMVNFQPCLTTRTQDRYVVRELKVGDTRWSFSGVFDGHLGETTVEHVAYHLPLIVEQNIRQLVTSQPHSLSSPSTISDLLSRSIKSLDDSITDSILSLFGAKSGDLSALNNLSDKQIWEIVNDQHMGGENWKKVRVGMYGCTAVVALVRLDTSDDGSASGSNVWVGNLGDCQAILVTPVGSDDWDVQVITTEHNGYNQDEINRVRKEHPNEPESVVGGRVLGALAPFRCIGDTPFKQPPEFTRRILYNLLPRTSGGTNGHTSPWEEFLARNKTPPYISNDPEVIHLSLSTHQTQDERKVDQSRPRFLILASDGFTDICRNKKDGESSPEDIENIIKDWARGMVDDMHTNITNNSVRVVPENISSAASLLPLSTSPPVATPLPPLGSFGSFGSPPLASPFSPSVTSASLIPSSIPSRNMALRLLRRALGSTSNSDNEEDAETVSKVLTLKNMDLAWIDDVSIVVQTI